MKTIIERLQEVHDNSTLGDIPQIQEDIKDLIFAIYMNTENKSVKIKYLDQSLKTLNAYKITK